MPATSMIGVCFIRLSLSGTGRLTFEVADEKIPSGPEYLTEMIISMTPDPECASLKFKDARNRLWIRGSSFTTCRASCSAPDGKSLSRLFKSEQVCETSRAMDS